MDGYRLGRAGQASQRQVVSEHQARVALRDRLESIGGNQYRIRYPFTWDWGPPLGRAEAIDRMFAHVPDFGDKAQVRRASDTADAIVFTLIHAFASAGPEVVQIALDQLGDEYTWASTGPNEFDCSGLIIYCYQRVGVWFPVHSADAIMKSDAVRSCTAAQVRDGDLIGYHVGRLPAGQFDHIGIAVRRDDGSLWVVDASSSADRVVFRPADSNPIAAFGYVPTVTGPH